MDDPVRKALKRQKELRLELEKLERFIVTYEELSGKKISRDELTLSSDIGEKSPQLGEQTTKEVFKRRRNNIKKLLAVSERLIKEAQRPLTRTEIAEGMARLGVTVHATNIPKYLGTLLWRNPDRFVSSDGDGYMTKELYDSTIGQIQEDDIQDQKARDYFTRENDDLI